MPDFVVRVMTDLKLSNEDIDAGITYEGVEAGTQTPSLLSLWPGQIRDVKAWPRPLPVRQSTRFWHFVITDVPANIVQKFKRRLREPNWRTDPDGDGHLLEMLCHSRFSIGGSTPTRAAVLATLKARFTGLAFSDHVDAYFNNTTYMPIEEIKSVPWSVAQTQIRDLRQGVDTQGTEFDGDE